MSRIGHPVRRLPVAALCLLAVVAAWDRAEALTPDHELLRYHERFQRQSHNAYEHEWLRALDNGVMNVEIDIRNHNPYNGRQDWKVRHSAHGGDKNRCGGGNRSFAVCLRDLRAWHDAHPGHYPITIIIDKKDGWQNGKARGPADFDARVSRELGAGNIFRPAELLRGFPNLRAAARAGAWPAITSLRGKFVLLMTPHENWAESRSKANDKAHDYVRARGGNALAFVCPRGHAREIAGRVAGFDSSTSRWVVCFNHKEDQISGDGGYGDGRALQQAGYILRVWSVDSSSKYQRAVVDSRANFIAVDYPDSKGHYFGGRTEGGHVSTLLPAILPTLRMGACAATAAGCGRSTRLAALIAALPAWP
ncbi:MAG: Ca2+-dependent phosphoinositide-specific phospholipase C [Gammaproteobacteria bacterium]|nr:Ca2+-dependent phosphoinositide-specific phospholipase C [Gammaproteobacteria bacterium]